MMTASRASPFIRALVTAGGVGSVPKAPGTFGTLAALPLAWLLHWAGGIALLAAGTVAVTLAGHWATARYLEATGRDDPSEVVIDEVAGMMLALWPFSAMLGVAGVEAHVFPWPGWVLGFVVFRFFDIVKPPPVSWGERAPGALGVMLDDLIAGALTGALCFIAAGVAHGWF
jgi:phosphatidylglycerophosphatase A